MASAPPAGGPDRSSGRERWLLAGQELLRRGGIRVVKIEALAESAGLTTGSFYHHFPNMAGYREALATFYGSTQVEAALREVGGADPRSRLERLGTIARERAMGPLDAAMRDWAATDPLAEDAVRALDATLLEHIAAAFRDLGHDDEGARVRSLLLLAAGVARVHPPWRLADPLAAVLDVLSPPAARS